MLKKFAPSGIRTEDFPAFRANALPTELPISFLQRENKKYKKIVITLDETFVKVNRRKQRVLKLRKQWKKTLRDKEGYNNVTNIGTADKNHKPRTVLKSNVQC